MDVADTIKLSEKETTATVNDNDYVVIVTSTGNVRKLKSSILKEYVEKDVLGGES